VGQICSKFNNDFAITFQCRFTNSAKREITVGTTTIFEPPADSFEAEHRGRYQPVPTSHVGVIVQGSTGFGGYMLGNDDDSEFDTYDVRMLVGPFWRDVRSVVPKVTVDGFYSTNPDQDDYMRWKVRDLTWDTGGEFGQTVTN
jgi:hypothetical protein